MFCRFKLPALLRLTLFGGDEYRNIKNYEIIKKTNRVVVIHISLQDRMLELFTVSGQQATIIHNGCFIKACGAKVGLQKMGSIKNSIGYVISEIGFRWYVLLDNGSHVWMQRLEYDLAVGTYKLCDNYDDNNLKITEYWPIRLEITHRGQCKVIFNRMHYNKNTSRFFN